MSRQIHPNRPQEKKGESLSPPPRSERSVRTTPRWQLQGQWKSCAPKPGLSSIARTHIPTLNTSLSLNARGSSLMWTQHFLCFRRLTNYPRASGRPLISTPTQPQANIEFAVSFVPGPLRECTLRQTSVVTYAITGNSPPPKRRTPLRQMPDSYLLRTLRPMVQLRAPSAQRRLSRAAIFCSLTLLAPRR